MSNTVQSFAGINFVFVGIFLPLTRILLFLNICEPFQLRPTFFVRFRLASGRLTQYGVKFYNLKFEYICEKFFFSKTILTCLSGVQEGWFHEKKSSKILLHCHFNALPPIPLHNMEDDERKCPVVMKMNACSLNIYSA